MQGFGMGRYVPPEYEGTVSANKLVGKHALGKRANKIKEGILTVRFEMPFAVWCNHCPKPTIIGQGVRFNAEKKKVGNYHSTPIWSFRMKHAACGGWIEIHTDPKNTAYVVKEGGKARDTGEDRIREGEEGVPILTAEERECRREDAFAALEGKKEDQVQKKENGKRVQELLEMRDRDWEDPYEASKRLRKTFRAERKVRVKEHKETENLKDKMGLNVELVPEDDADRRRAALIDFGTLTDADDGALKATSKPLFQLQQPASSESPVVKGKPTSKRRAAAEAERKKQALQQELLDNSRAANDPFLSFGNSDARTSRVITGIKRKRYDGRSEQDERGSECPERFTSDELPPVSQVSLVAYDSD